MKSQQKTFQQSYLLLKAYLEEIAAEDYKNWLYPLRTMSEKFSQLQFLIEQKKELLAYYSQEKHIAQLEEENRRLAQKLKQNWRGIYQHMEVLILMMKESLANYYQSQNNISESQKNAEQKERNTEQKERNTEQKERNTEQKERDAEQNFLKELRDLLPSYLIYKQESELKEKALMMILKDLVGEEMSLSLLQEYMDSLKNPQ